MYNVCSQRTSRYESNKDLTSQNDSQRDDINTVFDNKLHLQSKHGSLENTSTYRKPPHGYGSLERNIRKKGDRRFERKHSDTDTTADYSDLTPSKFGSKRTSQSEYDLSSKGNEFSSAKDSDQISSRDYGSRTTGDYSYKSDQFTPSIRGKMIEDSYKSDHFVPSLRNRMIEDTYRSDHFTPSRGKLIEVPVTHEGYSSNPRSDHRSKDYHSHSRSGWQDTPVMESSPEVQSPTKSQSDHYLSGGKSHMEQYGGGGDCYSPRSYEGSRHKPFPTELNVKHMDSPFSLPQPTSSKIVTVAKASPHVEVSKPFEMSDFFRYSEKLRRLRLVEQYQQELMGSRASSPSHHSSESDTPSYLRSHQIPTHSQFHSGSNSSPINSPLSSRHMNFSTSRSQDGDHSGYGNSVSSTSYQQGVSTSTSRVQYTVQTRSGQVLYKAQHQSSKHTHYQPPTAMKCNPVRETPKVTTGNNISHSGR